MHPSLTTFQHELVLYAEARPYCFRILQPMQAGSIPHSHMQEQILSQLCRVEQQPTMAGEMCFDAVCHGERYTPQNRKE